MRDVGAGAYREVGCLVCPADSYFGEYAQGYGR